MKQVFVGLALFTSISAAQAVTRPAQALDNAAQYTGEYSYWDDNQQLQTIGSFSSYSTSSDDNVIRYQILNNNVQFTCVDCNSTTPLTDTVTTVPFSKLQSLAPSLFPADYSNASIEPLFLSQVLGGYNDPQSAGGELFSFIDSVGGESYLDIYSYTSTSYVNIKNAVTLPTKVSIPLGRQFTQNPTLDGYIYPPGPYELIRMKANGNSYLTFDPSWNSIQLIPWAIKQTIMASLQGTIPSAILNQPNMNVWSLYFDQFSSSGCADVNCFRNKSHAALKQFRQQAHFSANIQFNVMDWNKKVIPALYSISQQEKKITAAFLAAHSFTWKVAEDLDHVSIYTDQNTQPVLTFQATKYLAGGLTFLFKDAQ